MHFLRAAILGYFSVLFGQFVAELFTTEKARMAILMALRFAYPRRDERLS